MGLPLRLTISKVVITLVSILIALFALRARWD